MVEDKDGAETKAKLAEHARNRDKRKLSICCGSAERQEVKSRSTDGAVALFFEDDAKELRGDAKASDREPEKQFHRVGDD
ncbi:MAG: hypothetical protein MOB07_17840 [Acidobacteria bacterium]|nr:hypothetical protein [Acidobacteriota bacterium]